MPTSTPCPNDLSGQLVFLGTGTSYGVPMIGCSCPTCTSDNPRNNRTRSSVLLGLPKGNLLIDTPPELRVQLIRERIGLVHAVAYTHAHADHLFGLDDVRVFPRYLGEDLPVYCDEAVERSIRQSFGYAFDPVTRQYPAGGVPRLAFHPLDDQPVEVLGARLVPIRLNHGQFDVLGFRIGDLAYCTDVKRIPRQSEPLLRGLDLLILGCLRHEPHPTHLSVKEALAAIERLAPKQTFLTHLCHHLEHDSFSRSLPPNVRVAHDGLRLPLRGYGRIATQSS